MISRRLFLGASSATISAELFGAARESKSPNPALEKIRKFTEHLNAIALPAERIAEVVAAALTSAHPKVRYQITPDPMRHLITGMLPKRMVDKIIARRLGLMPQA